MGLERNRPLLKKTCRIARYVYKNHNKYYVVYHKKNIAKCDSEEEAIKERDRLINEGKIIPQRRGRKPRCEEDRYIRRVKGKYTLQKSINGKTEYFGTFKTLEEARSERDLLESINWKWEDVDLL